MMLNSSRMVCKGSGAHALMAPYVSLRDELPWPESLS